MKLIKLLVLMFICNPLILFAQINERFNGESISGIWQGDNSLFAMSDNRLQLKAPEEAGQSYLSAPSTAITNAEWTLSLQMNFNPTSSNYMKFYLCSDSPVLTDALNGYYLQIGGNTDKQISLYRQTGKTNKKLGNSEAKRLDMNPAQIEVKVSKDDSGNWTVWSKKADETGFTEEFTCQDATWESSSYMGFVCIYTKTNSKNFFLDSISAYGDAYIDKTAPALLSHSVWKDSLLLRFSECVLTEQAVFNFSASLAYQTEWRNKQTEAFFHFNLPLESGKKYMLRLESVPDLSGNILSDSTIPFALAEPALAGDIIINEVLFNPPTGGVDYVEIYNRSSKALDLSQLKLATRNSSDALYASKSLGKTENLIFPGEYIVLTTDKEKVCSFYDCQNEDAFLILPSLPTYGNEKGCVVLTDKNNEVIDEFRYLASMHSSFIKDKKGVSLERESFDSDDWASASESNGFGTPGYENSQHSETSITETYVKLENDVCLPYQDKEGHLSILYHFKKGGYIANISVFNVNGRLIRKLGDNMSLSTQGIIYWDGKDENGRILPISPYILLFEAFHPDGDIFRKSLVGIISK